MARFAKFSVGLLFVFVQSVFAANYTVTKIADTNDGMCDADCSLREAITAANGTADNDTVLFALPFFASAQTITLSGIEIVIANNGTLTINGPGANRLTVSGNNASRILATSTGSSGTIRGIRFTAGNGVGAANTGRAGAFYNNGGTFTLIGVVITGNTAANGGGANHAGAATTTYINCVISNNTSSSSGGGLQNFSTSTLNLINTTVNNNTSTSSTTGGGGIQANGMLNVINTTFSGNTVGTGSGGAFYYNGTGLTMTNSTIVNNTSPSGAGGFHKSTATNNANIRNSMFSGNSTADAANLINSLGNNIIGVVGTSTGWVASDLQNTNPLLTPLGFHGGMGMTHVPVATSPAINAGQNCVVDLSCAANNPTVAVTGDQRGAARPANTTVDIGAVESSGAYTAILPSSVLSQLYNQVISPNVGSFTYSATAGSPPPGIAVSTGNLIAVVGGTPTQTGTFDFAVTAADGANSAVVNYRLDVLTDPAIVSVSGQVLTSSGTPVRNAIVSLTDPAGGVIYSRTNGFGYYRFDSVPAGQTYAVSSNSKEYQFSSQIITTSDVIGDLNLIALP